MKQKPRSWTALACFLALTFLFSNTTGCIGIILDRTTTIYGKVTDDYHQPVDSAVIIISSSGFFKPAGIIFKEVYTEKDGSYKIKFDAPKGYKSINVYVDLNKERVSKYKYYLPSLNGERIVDCCPVSIGKMANYDFLLISR